jgi:hypothetical protein
MKESGKKELQQNVPTKLQIVPPPQFKYNFDGDKNGAFYYLGTCGYVPNA